MSENLVCQKINNGKKCNDYLTGEGDPAWCFQAGQPAQVAVQKCPKANGEEESPKQVKGKGAKDEQ